MIFSQLFFWMLLGVACLTPVVVFVWRACISRKCCFVTHSKDIFCGNSLGDRSCFCHKHLALGIFEAVFYLISFGTVLITYYQFAFPDEAPPDPIREELQFVEPPRPGSDPVAYKNFARLPGESYFPQFCEKLRAGGAHRLGFSNLSQRDLADFHLAVIADKFDNLTHLNAENNKNVTNGELLRKFRWLQSLWIRNTGITDAAFLTSLGNLQELRISHVSLSSDLLKPRERGGMMPMAHLTKLVAHSTTISDISFDGSPKLNWLELERCTVGRLNLSGAPLLSRVLLPGTDMPWFYGSNLPRLVEFTISDSELRWFGLVKCPELDRLIVRNNQLLVLNIAGCGRPHELQIQDNPALLAIQISDTLPASVFVMQRLPLLKIVSVSDHEIVAKLNSRSRVEMRSNGVHLLVAGKLTEW